jgi:UDP-N-acetylmuramoyl-tripeptide--D-alanyl-D-alanine ligase
VHTDTRSLQPGDLFVALRGERFDGTTSCHRRAQPVHWPPSPTGLAEAGLPGLEVPDTLRALGSWRAAGALSSTCR